MHVWAHSKTIFAALLACLMFLLPCLSVSAAEEDTEQKDYIVLVSESSLEDEKVYYYSEGEKKTAKDMEWSNNGVNKNALHLDGKTQYLRLSTAAASTFDEFTFSGWFYWFGTPDMKETDKEMPTQRLFHFSKNDHYYISLTPHAVDAESSKNGLELCIENGLDEPITLYHEVTGTVSAAYPTESWHHVALTVSDTEIILYIDGAVYCKQEMENFSAASLSRLVVGADSQGEHHYAGLVDDTLVYNKALNADEVLLLMQNEDPKDGATPTTKAEILATRPKTAVTKNEAQQVRVLGMSPLVFAILGAAIVIAVGIALLLGLRFQKTRTLPEEDHP